MKLNLNLKVEPSMKAWLKKIQKTNIYSCKQADRQVGPDASIGEGGQGGTSWHNATGL